MSLTRLWCLVLSVEARATAFHTFFHSTTGVNVCVNTTCTTKPDPSQHSHMSPTQPHMHGKSTGGLHHSQGLHHLTSHLTSHSGLGLTHVHSDISATPSSLGTRFSLCWSAHAARCGYPNGEMHRALGVFSAYRGAHKAAKGQIHGFACIVLYPYVSGWR